MQCIILFELPTYKVSSAVFTCKVGQETTYLLDVHFTKFEDHQNKPNFCWPGTVQHRCVHVCVRARDMHACEHARTTHNRDILIMAKF